MKKCAGILGGATAVVIAFSAVTLADSHVPSSVKARQAVMQLNSYYLSILGKMASGKTKYNAKLAVASAKSLKLIEADGIDQSTMWAPGTSTAELGNATRAKPEIWSTWPAIMKPIKGIKAAINAMVAAAGTLKGLQSTIGDVGKACTACHTYRAGKK
jgi:cytochrome c556